MIDDIGDAEAIGGTDQMESVSHGVGEQETCRRTAGKMVPEISWHEVPVLVPANKLNGIAVVVGLMTGRGTTNLRSGWWAEKCTGPGIHIPARSEYPAGSEGSLPLSLGRPYCNSR